MNGDQNRIKEEENARVGYQVAVDLLIAEGEGIWSRFNVMMVANSIIIAIIGLAPTNQPTPAIFDNYLPFVGLVLCIWWFVLINRGYSYRDYFIQTARELEEQYLANSVRTLSRGETFSNGNKVMFRFVDSSKELDMKYLKYFPAIYASNFVIVVFAILYGILILT